MSRRSHSPGELGAFLKARRSDIDPAAAGLAVTGGPRRVPGLRREEVAQLAMISTDYYTRLEQGRLAGASPAVLNSLATALRLGPDERSYLYQLASKSDRQQPRKPRVERVADAIESVPGTDPDRASFTIALETARDQVIQAANIIAATVIDLAGTIGRRVLDNLMPDRRLRLSPRAVKRPLSRYAYKSLKIDRRSYKATLSIDILTPPISP